MAAAKDSDVVIEARRLANIAIDDKWKLPTGLVATEIVKEADATEKQLDTINAARQTLKNLVSAKKKAVTSLNKKIARLRSGIKAEYGDDSLEYEKAGGKRASERKRRTVKPKIVPV